VCAWHVGGRTCGTDSVSTITKSAPAPDEPVEPSFVRALLTTEPPLHSRRLDCARLQSVHRS
jgi:hypothetical protein